MKEEGLQQQAVHEVRDQVVRRLVARVPVKHAERDHAAGARELGARGQVADHDAVLHLGALALAVGSG